MRGLGNMFKGAVFLAAWGATSVVMGAAGDIVQSVTTITPNVTYSTLAEGKLKGQTTQAIYLVSLSNLSTNTINSVVFEGTTTVTNSQEAATFLSADGASCSVVQTTSTAKNAQTTRCSLGQFKSGDARSFYLFFQAPVQVLPGVDPDNVMFSGRVLYGEGTNGGNSFENNNNSINAWAAGDVLLGTPSAVSLKSGAPKTGAIFFTGKGGVPGAIAGDEYATTVSIPTSGLVTTTDIFETLGGTSASGTCLYFSNCYRSTITVNIANTTDTAEFTNTNYLTFFLRVDSLNIPSGSKNAINAVQIKYYPNPLDLSNFYQLGACASPTTPVTSEPLIPCIAKRTYYRNKGVTGWTPDLDGDFEFQLIGLRNGMLAFD